MKEVKVEYVNLDDDRTIEDLEKERDELQNKILSEKYQKYSNEDFKEDDEFKEIVRRINSINKVLEEKREIRDYGRILSDEERKEKWEKIEQEAVRMGELLADQEQREAEIRKQSEETEIAMEELRKLLARYDYFQTIDNADIKTLLNKRVKNRFKEKHPDYNIIKANNELMRILKEWVAWVCEKYSVY